jgi:hypothetical protein
MCSSFPKLSFLSFYNLENHMRGPRQYCVTYDARDVAAERTPTAAHVTRASHHTQRRPLCLSPRAPPAADPADRPPPPLPRSNLNPALGGSQTHPPARYLFPLPVWTHSIRARRSWSGLLRFVGAETPPLPFPSARSPATQCRARASDGCGWWDNSPPDRGGVWFASLFKNDGHGDCFLFFEFQTLTFLRHAKDGPYLDATLAGSHIGYSTARSDVSALPDGIQMRV